VAPPHILRKFLFFLLTTIIDERYITSILTLLRRKSVKPDYRNDRKQKAHLKNIEVWSHLTGRRVLSPEEQYWTLMDDNSFELQTLEEQGFLKKAQFHGVNRDAEKVQACKTLFPGIETYLGEWTDIVRRYNPCTNGGLVYLDTMSQLDQISPVASTLLTATLDSVGPNTLVCANYCMDNPRSPTKKIPYDVFVSRILDRFEFSTATRSWEHIKFGQYDAYLPGKVNQTQMITFFFWRSR